MITSTILSSEEVKQTVASIIKFTDIRMTLPDPLIQKFFDHLSEIYSNPYVTPDETLLNEVEDKLRYDNILQQDNSLLIQMAPTVLKIINSNETTGLAKNYAIKFLDVILPYYSINSILTVFNEALLVKAFTGSDYLKCVIAKLLERVDPSRLKNDVLFLCLFKCFANPDTDISTVSAVQKAIISMTLKSDNIRQKYLNDYEIVNVLNDMKSDNIVKSRVVDLVCEILPVIPNLPASIYLGTEEELAKSNDTLFYSFCLGTWTTLLHLVEQDDSLLFLKKKMYPQYDFCCRRLTNKETLLDGKECFIEYDDFGSVYFIVTLSFVFPDVFKEFDEKYQVIDYTIGTYKQYHKSKNFLESVNSIFLRNKNQLFDNFNLTNRYVNLFVHFLKDKTILEKQITNEKFPQSIFNNLVFDGILEIFVTMCESHDRISKLINDWPLLLTKVLNAKINNNLLVSTGDLEIYLELILRSGLDLGNLKKQIQDRIDGLQGKTQSVVSDPLTEGM